MKRLAVRVKGIVQGVGFRPFVYRLARQNSLTGFVFNDDEGVLLEIQGEQDSLAKMTAALRTEAPPAASVTAVIVQAEKVLSADYIFTL